MPTTEKRIRPEFSSTAKEASCHYSQKQALEFFAKMDQRFYFMNSCLRQFGNRRQPRAKRIVAAFNLLYEEYGTVCQLLEELNGATGNVIQPQRATMQEAYNNGEGISTSASRFGLFGKNQGVFNFSTRQAISGNRAVTHSRPELLPQEYFNDNLKMTYQPTPKIAVYRCFKAVGKQVRHRVCYNLSAPHSGSPTNYGCTYAPVVLEMLIPKVQRRIEKVMRYCPHIFDPLEVVAELRLFNYNTVATIRHLQRTKTLRTFLNDNVNSHLDPQQAFQKFYCHSNTAFPMPPIVSYDTLPDYNISPDVSNIFSQSIDDDCDSFYEVSQHDCATEVIVGQGSDTGRSTAVEQEQEPEKNARSCNPTPFQCDTLNQFTSCATSPLLEMPSFNPICHTTTAVQTEPSKKEISQTAKFNFYTSVIKCTVQEVRALKSQNGHLRSVVEEIQMESLSALGELRNTWQHFQHLAKENLLTESHRSKMILLSRQVEELRRRLKEEEAKRRQLFNEMQECLGNIRVYCRARFLPPECSGEEHLLKMVRGKEMIVCMTSSGRESYEFDAVFTSLTPQAEVYEQFKPLVHSFLDGYNVCFIAYGGEASGKTYSLIGRPEEEHHGLIHNAFKTILTELHQRKREWKLDVSVAALEIYNDSYGDLLEGTQNLSLFMEAGLDKVTAKMTRKPIADLDDVTDLLAFCRSRRKVAKTALNPASSRSHLMLITCLTGKNLLFTEKFTSYLAFCDLAGFEDIRKAETMRDKTLSTEASFINKSLTAFNRVFVNLKTQNPSLVQYRDSKLTHFLKPFLTNSGKCAVLVAVRSDPDSRSTTQSSLRFGQSIREIALGKAKKQIQLEK